DRAQLESPPLFFQPGHSEGGEGMGRNDQPRPMKGDQFRQPGVQGIADKGLQRTGKRLFPVPTVKGPPDKGRFPYNPQVGVHQQTVHPGAKHPADLDQTNIHTRVGRPYPPQDGLRRPGVTGAEIFRYQQDVAFSGGIQGVDRPPVFREGSPWPRDLRHYHLPFDLKKRELRPTSAKRRSRTIRFTDLLYHFSLPGFPGGGGFLEVHPKMRSHLPAPGGKGTGGSPEAERSTQAVHRRGKSAHNTEKGENAGLSPAFGVESSGSLATHRTNPLSIDVEPVISLPFPVGPQKSSMDAVCKYIQGRDDPCLLPPDRFFRFFRRERDMAALFRISHRGDAIG